jgi:hypothetical protein
MEQAVRLLSFRMRSLKLWIIDLLENTIHFMDLES